MLIIFFRVLHYFCPDNMLSIPYNIDKMKEEEKKRKKKLEVCSMTENRREQYSKKRNIHINLNTS